MRINISGKGIHRREITGIEKLRELPSEWYCFTNLELIEPGSMPRQIDVVIVLEDRITYRQRTELVSSRRVRGRHGSPDRETRD